MVAIIVVSLIHLHCDCSLAVAPVLVEGPEDVNVTSVEGVITLYCEGTGFPIPDITWYQNGTAIEDSSDDRVMVTATISMPTRTVNSSLVITTPMVNNSGHYHCILSSSVSEYDQVTSQALVLVQGMF